MSNHDIDEVVLVGGACRVPYFRRAMREFFHGKVPREILRPNHAAVLGAAAYAASLADKVANSTDMDDGFLVSQVPLELQDLRLQEVKTFTMVPEETVKLYV